MLCTKDVMYKGWNWIEKRFENLTSRPMAHGIINQCCMCSDISYIITPPVGIRGNKEQMKISTLVHKIQVTNKLINGPRTIQGCKGSFHEKGRQLKKKYPPYTKASSCSNEDMNMKQDTTYLYFDIWVIAGRHLYNLESLERYRYGQVIDSVEPKISSGSGRSDRLEPDDSRWDRSLRRASAGVANLRLVSFYK